MYMYMCTLSLNGVKEGEEVRVQMLILLVAEGSNGEGLEVQQFSRGRELLGEDEVPEGHWELGL